MPSKTTNFNLIKPSVTDSYDINDFNKNSDTIDTVLKQHSDNIELTASAQELNQHKESLLSHAALFAQTMSKPQSFNFTLQDFDDGEDWKWLKLNLTNAKSTRFLYTLYLDLNITSNNSVHWLGEISAFGVSGSSGTKQFATGTYIDRSGTDISKIKPVYFNANNGILISGENGGQYALAFNINGDTSDTSKINIQVIRDGAGADTDPLKTFTTLDGSITIYPIDDNVLGSSEYIQLTEALNQVQDAMLIINPLNDEVIAARESENISYPTIGKRFEANEQNIQETKTETAKNTVSLKSLQNILTNLNLTGAERLEQTTASDVVSLPANAAEGGVKGVIRGMTLSNLVNGKGAVAGGTVAFGSILDNKYYDSLHKTILTGTGSSMTVTNDTEANADMMIIDMTAHGLEDKTAEEMAHIAPNYIDGTQHNTVTRLRSVGKNLLSLYSSKIKSGAFLEDETRQSVIRDYDIIVGVSRDGYYKSYTVNTFSINPFTNTINLNTTEPGYGIGVKVKAFEGQKFSFNRPTINGVGAFDENGNNLGHTTVSPFTAPPKTDFIIAVFTGEKNTDLTFTNAQLEKGTTATEYAPYIESSLYIEPFEHKRLPNGTCDTTDLSTGKRVQKIMPYVLKAEDIQSIQRETNVDLVYTKNNFISHVTWKIGIQGAVSIKNMQETSIVSYDDIANIGKFALSNNQLLYFIVAKDVYANVSEAQQAFAGTKILYQLAPENYIITKNVTSGVAKSYPNGIIYAERALLDVGFYKGNFEISRTEYPIKELEALYRVNQETGAETPLDVSNAVIAENKWTITHPDLSDGDLVDGSYTFDYSGINGINTFSYIDNNAVVLGDDGKYYKIGFSVIGGAPQITATEVQ